MGSSFTCKQQWCCGNMRDCTGPTRPEPKPAKKLPTQVDCEFKMKHVLRGAHVHTTIYVRDRGQSTWQNCGTVAVDDRQYNSLLGALALITNYEEEGFHEDK